MYKIININEHGNCTKKLSEILTEIHNELFSDKTDEKYFSDILNNNRYSVYCLAENKSKEILGYVVYYDTTENIDLFEIGIRKKYQGKGYGNILLRNTVNIFCNIGKNESNILKKTDIEKKIFLEVNENNAKAIKLYEKNGFEKISVRKNYYGNGNNAVIMVKN